MQGAREYAKLFETGQYGRLYIVSGGHTRGTTFHLYVLPIGEVAKSNGPNNPPICEDAVEVYGIIGGNPGWTETYGWLHMGKWTRDFETMVAVRQAEIAAEDHRHTIESGRDAKAEQRQIQALLDTY